MKVELDQTGKALSKDRRFYNRNKLRGLAVGSTRPKLQQNPRKHRHLENTNFGVDVMPLSCVEQEKFAVYVMDSSGSRHQIHGKYSAGHDGTLRLQSSRSQTSSRDFVLLCMCLTRQRIVEL